MGFPILCQEHRILAAAFIFGIDGMACLNAFCIINHGQNSISHSFVCPSPLSWFGSLGFHGMSSGRRQLENPYRPTTYLPMACQPSDIWHLTV